MEGMQEFLSTVRERGLAAGRLRGLFHILIGRRISKTDGTVVCSGMTWRELADHLKDAKFDKELAAEVGAEPEELSPRDRKRYWYSAIALAKPDSPEALAQVELLIPELLKIGYEVGPAPKHIPDESPEGTKKRQDETKRKRK